MNRFRFLWVIAFFITIYSCNSYKRFTYLQPSNSQATDSSLHSSIIFYKIQPADIIYVRISSLDEKVSMMMNQSMSNSTGMMAGAAGGSTYLSQYSVNAEGYITMPVLGKIHVANNTIEEVRAKIQELTKMYLKDAVADIKLVSFKITLLGEFETKGQITIFNDRASWWQGDLCKQRPVGTPCPGKCRRYLAVHGGRFGRV